MTVLSRAQSAYHGRLPADKRVAFVDLSEAPRKSDQIALLLPKLSRARLSSALMLYHPFDGRNLEMVLESGKESPHRALVCESPKKKRDDPLDPQKRQIAAFKKCLAFPIPAIAVYSLGALRKVGRNDKYHPRPKESFARALIRVLILRVKA